MHYGVQKLWIDSTESEPWDWHQIEMIPELSLCLFYMLLSVYIFSL